MRVVFVIAYAASLAIPAAAETAPAVSPPANAELAAALGDTAAQLRSSFGPLQAELIMSMWTGYQNAYETMDILGRIAQSGGAAELAAACREGLASEDIYTRITAASFLQQIDGPAAVGPFLREEYKRATADDVYVLTIFLGTALTVGGGESLPGAADLWPLVAADLNGDDAGARLKAARFLAFTPTKEGEPLFLQALNSPDVAVRRFATASLTKCYVDENSSQMIRDNLVAALKDEDAEIRRTAASSLGQTGETSTLKPLLAALADADVRVRRAAAGAVSSLLRQTANEDKNLPKELVKALKVEKDPLARVYLATAYGSAKAGVEKGVSYCDITPDGYWAFFGGAWKEKDLDKYYAPVEDAGPTGGG